MMIQLVIGVYIQYLYIHRLLAEQRGGGRGGGGGGGEGRGGGGEGEGGGGGGGGGGEGGGEGGGVGGEGEEEEEDIINCTIWPKERTVQCQIRSSLGQWCTI